MILYYIFILYFILLIFTDSLSALSSYLQTFLIISIFSNHFPLPVDRFFPFVRSFFLSFYFPICLSHFLAFSFQGNAPSKSAISAIDAPLIPVRTTYYTYVPASIWHFFLTFFLTYFRKNYQFCNSVFLYFTDIL